MMDDETLLMSADEERLGEVVAEYMDWLNGRRREPPDRRRIRLLPAALREEFWRFQRDARALARVAREIREAGGIK